MKLAFEIQQAPCLFKVILFDMMMMKKHVDVSFLSFDDRKVYIPVIRLSFIFLLTTDSLLHLYLCFLVSIAYLFP